MLLLFLGIALGTYIVYALQAEKTPEEPLNRVRTIPKYTHFSIDDATQIFRILRFMSMRASLKMRYWES